MLKGKLHFNHFHCVYIRLVGTMNKSNSSTHMMHFPRAEFVIWFTAMLILSLAIVTLNIITVIAFVSNCQILISLAVADMLVGAVTSPLHLQLFGAFCGLWKYEIAIWDSLFIAVYRLFPLVSLSHLVAVSLERLYVTLCPFKYRSVKDKTYGIVIAIVWLIPTLTAIALAIAFEFGSISPYLFIWTWICYPLVVLVSICVCYFIILIKVRCSSLPRRHGAANRERNLTITLFIVTAVFLLAWMPLVVISFNLIFKTFFYEMSLLTLIRMDTVVVILYQANSLINPIVYTIRMPEFRKAASTLLCKKRRQGVKQIRVPEKIVAFSKAK